MNKESKPTVLIYKTQNASVDNLKEILYGIEEEGIPYSIEDREVDSLDDLAYTASHNSVLSVGIGYDGDAVALHHYNLSKGQNVFKISSLPKAAKEVKRSFGSNAARLIKGTPFKLHEGMEATF